MKHEGRPNVTRAALVINELKPVYFSFALACCFCV